MAPRWQTLRASIPGPLLWSFALAGGYLAFVAWDQSHWWRVREEYSFGWLAPFFVAFVVRDRWPRILAAVRTCAADRSIRAGGVQRFLLGCLVGGGLALGTLFFLLGAFFRAGAGPSQPGTLAITLGAVGVILPLMVLNAPAAPSSIPGGFFADARVRLAALFLFPTLVWLISAPLVSAIETQVSVSLMRRVVTVVAFVFDKLALPIEQQGNVLALPTGNVGVEEACSGIRSLTGCLFAGSFLAAVFVERLWQKIALIAAALVLAFLTNLARSLFLTAWAYRHGPRAIEGFVHDAAGYAVLGLTVVGLLVLVWVMNLRVRAVAPGNAGRCPAS